MSPMWLLGIWFQISPERDGRLRRLFRRLHVVNAFLIFGIVFHLLTFLFMEVGTLPWICLAYYICVLSPERIEAFRTCSAATAQHGT
jgi:hypothetical protein